MVESNKVHRAQAFASAPAIRFGLPLATVVATCVAGAAAGAASAILVATIGTLAAVVVLFWSSLQILSGDALPPAGFLTVEGQRPQLNNLSARRTMLIRALKDLQNEQALGKLELDDYEELTATYRAELKVVLKRIDDSLRPFRAKAEEAARDHLKNAGLNDGADPTPSTGPADSPATLATSIAERRVACVACLASNETDARFCKQCGAPIPHAPASGNPHATPNDANP